MVEGRILQGGTYAQTADGLVLNDDYPYSIFVFWLHLSFASFFDLVTLTLTNDPD
jgi:hypothetical protein